MPVHLAEIADREFEQDLCRERIQPGDEGYDAARAVWNAMIDRHPAMIVRCADVADVVAAVNFARRHELDVAVRGGGHSAAGLGTCDGGLVIDLSPMQSVEVDPEARTARVGGGCTWGTVDRATHPFGLAAPAGIISTTGVGGLTIGGGFGHLTRRYGLTVDNLLGVEMVLADGQVITADSQQNPDLFWAVRGGGGNFGIVTSFLFQLHPVHTVYAGPMLWHVEQAAEALAFYREYMASAPEEISGFFAFMTVPTAPPFPPHLHGKRMCGVVWCYTGPEEGVEETFGPVRRFGPPVVDFVHAMSFPALQAMFDASAPPGMQQYWRADFFDDLSDASVALHVKYGSQTPTPHSISHIYPLDGAVQRVDPSDTAFSYRDAKWAVVIAGADPDPANNDRIIRWTKDYWLALHPHSVGGAYVNFLMDEGPDRVRAAYRDNYARLAAIKTQYDPGNFFHINHNIVPLAQAQTALQGDQQGAPSAMD